MYVYLVLSLSCDIVSLVFFRVLCGVLLLVYFRIFQDSSSYDSIVIFSSFIVVFRIFVYFQGFSGFIFFPKVIVSHLFYPNPVRFFRID